MTCFIKLLLRLAFALLKIPRPFLVGRMLSPWMKVVVRLLRFSHCESFTTTTFTPSPGYPCSSSCLELNHPTPQSQYSEQKHKTIQTPRARILQTP